MKYHVIFREQARQEALDAATYIAEQGRPLNAERWYEGLERAIASLSDMPASCAPAREADRFEGVELRQLIYKSHRIIFTIRADTVHVLHLRHTARDELDRL